MITIYLLIVLITICYFYIKHKFSYWKNKNVPHVVPSFPYGNLQGVGKTIHIGIKIHETYKQAKTQDYPFFGMNFLLSPMLVPTDLDLLRNIMIKDFNYFSSRSMYHNERDDPLSAHLFNIDGMKWKNLRTKLTPTFTSGKMKFMFPTVVEVGKKFTKSLCDQTDNGKNEFDMKELLARYTTDVIGTCAFGVDCNSINDPNAKFRKLGQKIFDEPRQHVLLKFFTDAYPDFCRFLHIKSEHNDVSEFFMNALNETIEYREQNNISRNDFLDIMINLKNSTDPAIRLTFNEIAAQAYVFFAAGFETSSTTMTYALYELARNPDIQKRAHDEIIQIMEKYNNELTYDGIMEMTYIHQIIDEILRLYPPVSIIPRKATSDYQIPNMDYVISKHSLIAIPVYSIHHDPEHYDNPEQFNPENFTKEAIQNRHPCAYLPFGEGPRNCIGLRFGKMQAYIGLVTLLKDLKFTVSPRTMKTIKFEPHRLVLGVKEMILKIDKYEHSKLRI